MSNRKFLKVEKVLIADVDVSKYTTYDCKERRSIAEVGDFENQMFNLAMQFNSSTNVQLKTNDSRKHRSSN